MTEQKNNSAIIIFSGGQDSTTCLAWSKKKFDHVTALTFDYGQKHRIELRSAKKIAKITKTPLIIHKIKLFEQFKNNALINHRQKIMQPDKQKLPNTFVPGRNHFFISIAALYAYDLKIKNIVTGVCQTDYSGYPDCREDFVKSLEKTINLAFGKQPNSKQALQIHTPLMHLTKAQSIKLMQKLDQLDLLKYSHTCYQGISPACSKCPSCLLRLKGFEQAKIKDPIEYIP
ncbi:7-cyano-7-deazaguanine synthase QueC [Candidatus Peregrinibacteria bacterium]|nr:7-cyano-7-deazaguanine synthase QueC [Candidatus Peregrinibacteria bacterium]